MGAKYYVPGPCKISLGGHDLGITKAGISISIQGQLVPITDDEHGTEPADWIKAGKTAIVEATFNDMAKFKAALPMIGTLFGNLAKLTPFATQIGRLAYDGDPDNDTQFGTELIITERDTSNLWKAKYCLPTDPQQFMLASTQENLVPITFVVAYDESDQLFWTVPDYLVTV